MPFIAQGKTNWKYILIVVILAVIVGGGILWWVKTQQIPFPEFPEIKKPEKIKDETASYWKTYRNEKYGFEIKYPKEWHVVVGDTMSNVIHWAVPDKRGEMPWVMDLIISERKGKTVNEWIYRKDFPYEVIETIEVGGNKGIMVRDPATMGNEYHIVFFPVKNYMYSIGIASSPPEISANPVDLLKKYFLLFGFWSKN